jgi:hypothetical protein
LGQVKDRIPLKVIYELNLKDSDELFWRRFMLQRPEKVIFTQIRFVINTI